MSLFIVWLLKDREKKHSLPIRCYSLYQFNIIYRYIGLDMVPNLNLPTRFTKHLFFIDIKMF